MKKKKQEQQINYLDLIPVKAEGLKWHKDFRDRVILEVKNEGFFNGIAQKVFNRPEVTKIHLDVHGSYLWPFIDGERTVMDLAALDTCQYSAATVGGLLESIQANVDQLSLGNYANLAQWVDKLDQAVSFNAWDPTNASFIARKD